MLGAPLKAWRARRRARRAVLDFSTIDNHTLDDIGLRRSPFTAAAANDDLRHDAA